MAELEGSYRFGEGITNAGQVIQFTAMSNEFKQAQDALRRFRDITIPASALVDVKHGAYGRYSRYDLEQVAYGGGQNEAGGGYYEILNIRNAPEGRHPFVSHGYMHFGGRFSAFFAEWESIEDAAAHWDKTGQSRIVTPRTFEEPGESETKGLIRLVDTGYLSPWFYATGNASLVGDYVFPEDLAQDPTFSFGRRFLVPKQSRKSGAVLHELKTCMGCVVRDEPRKQNRWGGHDEQPDTIRKFRAIQWHDGSITEVYPTTPIDMLPVPLAGNDTWVVDAQRKFDEMLAGGNTNFTIEFADGGKFVGSYVPPAEKPKASAAGNYYVIVTFDDGKAKEGWVDGFTPTEDEPNIASHVERKFAGMGREVVRVETTHNKVEAGSKKWPGVYHSSLGAAAFQSISEELGR